MIAAVMAFSNLLLTQQTYSAERNGAHAHNRDLVPLKACIDIRQQFIYLGADHLTLEEGGGGVGDFW